MGILNLDGIESISLGVGLPIRQGSQCNCLSAGFFLMFMFTCIRILFLTLVLQGLMPGLLCRDMILLIQVNSQVNRLLSVDVMHLSVHQILPLLLRPSASVEVIEGRTAHLNPHQHIPSSSSPPVSSWSWSSPHQPKHHTPYLPPSTLIEQLPWSTRQ